MNAHPQGPAAEAEFAKLHGYAEATGRDPAEIGIEVWVSTAEGGPDDWRRAVEGWAALGVTHIALNTAYGRLHHERILDAHLAAMEAYLPVVADLAA